MTRVDNNALRFGTRGTFGTIGTLGTRGTVGTARTTCPLVRAKIGGPRKPGTPQLIYLQESRDCVTFFSKFAGQADNTVITILFATVMLSRGTPGQHLDNRTNSGTLDNKAFQQRSAVSEALERRNLRIYSNYAFCNTMSYFFSKIVERRAKNAATPIETASCVSHLGCGTVVEHSRGYSMKDKGES